MSEHIHEFYSEDLPKPHFHKVIALHHAQDLKWEEISEEVPLLPRGWYELSRLSSEDRIEFTRDYWFSKLPFSTTEGELEARLDDFFKMLDEIGIFAVQSKVGQPFDVHMVYSLKAASGFFQGMPPASVEMIEKLNQQFGDVKLPPGYLSFLRIHDGFSKYTDTGLIKAMEMARIYLRLQELLKEGILIRPDGEMIDPKHLIPFYESFSLHCYQCFYADWIPEEEIGNVYFSEKEHTISNFLDRNHLEDNLAFPSFLNWLVFYLEDIWHL